MFQRIASSAVDFKDSAKARMVNLLKTQGVLARKNNKMQLDQLVQMEEEGRALQEMTRTDGWRILESYIRDQKEDMFRRWSEGDETPGMRDRASELKRLVEYVQSKITAGDHAREQISEQIGERE